MPTASDQMQQYDPATGEVSNALRTGSDAAHFYENLLDAFSNPQLPANKGVQVADASDGLPDTAANTNTNTFSNFLDSQGSNLTSKQQDALAIRNFADNPEQALLTMAGTYVGEAANDGLYRSVA
jgi:hypothetical protein